MDSAASFGIQYKENSAVTEAPRLSLILLSAKSEDSLQGSVEKHSKYLQRYGSSRLRDLAYTLATRRQHYDHRTFCVSDGDKPLLAQPLVRTKNMPRSLIFVFTGQGAQWAEMGKKLITDFPSFRDNIKEMDNVLSRCNTPPSWNILGRIDISK